MKTTDVRRKSIYEDKQHQREQLHMNINVFISRFMLTIAQKITRDWCLTRLDDYYPLASVENHRSLSCFYQLCIIPSYFYLLCFYCVKKLPLDSIHICIQILSQLMAAWEVTHWCSCHTQAQTLHLDHSRTNGGGGRTEGQH